MRRLTKAHVEALLGTYDDDPVAALTTALRVVLDQPDAEWPTLLKIAGLTCERRIRLQAGQLDALDDLAAELNELRTLSA